MIYLGADHAGYQLKETIKAYLIKKRIAYTDLGTHSRERTDYPGYAQQVSRAVCSSRKHRGILICGTGTGMCIAANRFKGIRAAVAYDTYSARMARAHNDANVLCLRARRSNARENLRYVHLFLSTPFEGGRHADRIRKTDSPP